MPAYLIQHPLEKRREDVLVEDPNLTLSFQGEWAVFSDAGGVCLAIPSAQQASIQRVDANDVAEPAARQAG
ncbi:hypothetical protein ABZ135_01280 [Streptomyces sp. NPDC006339]|uniref:hypothetical protein n=1 Tax=Streptomyces sp. NPDC006339 TaxID=3156755 RepID=UPI0033BDB1B7